MTKSERWILSEWLVARDRTERFGERLLLHRARTPFAETDLVFETNHPSQGRRLSLIEVKSWSGEIWASHVISRQQLLRLNRARFYFESHYRCETQLIVAVVSQGAPAIRYFEH